MQAAGAVINSAVQQLLGVSKLTPMRYLNELDHLNYLQRKGTNGVGTGYVLKGSAELAT